MTLPMSPRPVVAAPGEPPPLVVRSDHASVRRRLAVFLTAFALLGLVSLAGAVWSASELGAFAGVAFAFNVVQSVFQMTFYAYYWGKRLGAEELMEVGPHGIRIHASGRGWVALPWASVGSVTRRWRSIVVTPASGVGPATPGVQGPTSDSVWRTLGRRGVSLGTQAITVDPATIRAAVAFFSGGRFTP